MTKLTFNGAATVSGFPRDKAFGFQIDGDVLTVLAGKDVFLRIEKEPVPQVENTPLVAVQQLLEHAKTLPVATPDNPKGKFDGAPDTGTYTTGTGETKEVVAGVTKPRKERGPNIKINDTDVISVDPALANPYGKLRGKYFEALQTGNGRTVGWWVETTLVKSLEGDARTMLRFFITEKVVKLVPQDQLMQPVTIQQPVTINVPAGTIQQPVFGSNQVQQPTFGQPQAPGALWTPQQPGGQPAPSGGPTFL